MSVKTKTELLSSINTDLANNNAGLISAEDVRTNMVDTVDSINSIVSSGNHDSEHPFYNNVRASSVEGGGFFIPESGIVFPNGLESERTQTEAYPGPGGISHDQLANRSASNNAHTQYLAVDGTRPMEENLPMGEHWINASGATYDNRGLRFNHHADGTDVEIGEGGNFVFSEGSKIDSGRSVAKAWINFDGSGVGTYGTPVVRGHHNVDEIEYLDVGKYKIYFKPGLLEDANFAVLASSNSRTTAASQEDFERNFIGVTQREIDGSDRANVTFLVLNDAGQYVDAELNDLVIFGYNKGEDAQPGPTVTPLS